MEAEIQPCAIDTSHEILGARTQTLPLVVASPHSGRHYPPEFVNAARLDRLALRRSEDGFVDELFARAPNLGAPLLRANFPRAYVDANREPFELDPRMFADPLPSYVNTRSARVAAGLGTIARVVASGADIYPGRLRLAEAMHRIRNYYWPYHNALRDLITATREEFGGCILLDCHSMPSVGGPMDQDPGYNRVDFVVGDCHGTSCSPRVSRTIERSLRELGYHVTRNAPYSGGFVTRHYGRPEQAVHAVQLEINRGLYMDERQVRRGPNLPRLARELECVMAALGTLDPARL